MGFGVEGQTEKKYDNKKQKKNNNQTTNLTTGTK